MVGFVKEGNGKEVLFLCDPQHTMYVLMSGRMC